MHPLDGTLSELRHAIGSERRMIVDLNDGSQRIEDSDLEFVRAEGSEMRKR
jgi:hypothetical protein